MPPIRLSLSAAALSIAAVPLIPLPARSQPLPACEPPRADEFLLIVVDPTDDIETQLRNALPGNATAIACTYLSDRVLRIDGFNTPEVAESWAQYASDASGLRTFVARPPAAPESPAIAPTPSIAPSATAAVPPADPFPQPTGLAAPSPTPAPPAAIAPPSPAPPAAIDPAAPVPPAAPVATAPTTTPTFNPQPLGAGYAVLVDYATRPEVAIDLRQALSRRCRLGGLRSAFLPAGNQTPDLAAANQVLQTLTQQNFTALLVDSQSAILLTPVVAKLD
ncbi:MAG: hypothetical protein HC895_05945 [Leptolyngbyaceae cyanobacterium SM1_3_5]|nr:hypothetical protein [Leptolyngbyaceae cyanobacterium SM1_3_5]